MAARTLRVLAWVMGLACTAIGLFHVVAGNLAIPGATDAGPTVDSLGRFLGAVFAGYGAAWLWAVRQDPVPARVVRWLAAVFLLGAAGRLLSLAVHGWPHWFQVVLTVIELVLPPVFLRLADADDRAFRGRRGGGAEAAAAGEG
ncbi:DUF4345 domain-containing protein [Streptomyces sp. NPDC058157]|uniref:DUF4345 domain-containing protein n=1 Tax=Streptomyces sp. NPDC058157 TaxID=3346360 RepID=UPI0036E8DDDA